MTVTAFAAADAERLFALLPAVYRAADAAPDTADGLLYTLLGMIADQRRALEDDLDQLYDDLFIETCAPWVVPYIGELVGVLPARQVSDTTATTRAQVANVIALRRRKGTADVLEELADDVTGWRARVVEMFRLLSTTQHLNHVRADAARTVSLRSARRLEELGTAFDGEAHNVDVRWIRTGRGRYGVPNLAVFVWPQVDLRHIDVDAMAVDATRFRFHPLGIDTELLTKEVGDSVIGRAATPIEVPWPISRRALRDDLLAAGPGATSFFYGPSASLHVTVATGPVAAQDVDVCSLGDSAGGWEHAGAVAAGRVAVDPERGRLVLGAGLAGPVSVRFEQAFGAAIGGGSYDRQTPTAATDEVVATDGSGDHTTIAAAIAAVGGAGVVAIDDNRTYVESVDTVVTAASTLAIRAGAQRRPVVRAAAGWRFDCAAGASVELDGLLITGGPVVVVGRPDRVVLRDCTLVPGLSLLPDGSPVNPEQASLRIETDQGVTPELVLERCITGPLLAPPQTTVTASDSIIEGEPLDTAVATPGPVTAMVAVSGPAGALPLGAAPNEVLLLAPGTAPVTIDLGTPADEQALAAALAAPPELPAVDAIAVDGRVVVTGGPDSISIRSVAGDATAATLGFTAADGTRWAVLGEPRGGPFAITAAQPRVGLRAGAGELVTVALGAPPGDLAGAATSLQTAIRALSNDAAHAEALVFTRGASIVVVPGATDERWSFASLPADRTTAGELGLGSPLPAIASDGAGGTGPLVRLDRVTVLGPMAATTLHAGDCLFDRPVTVARNQEGCVRFSYVAPGSSTPRRYRCLPDHDCRPRPAFASTRYGDPDYAELVAAPITAPIRFGSSDGDEMGAFAAAHRRRRELNLIDQLDEFMRFSMEAGVLDGRRRRPRR